MLICWFLYAQETFLIIIDAENSCAASYMKIKIHFIRFFGEWSTKEQHVPLFFVPLCLGKFLLLLLFSILLYCIVFYLCFSNYILILYWKDCMDYNLFNILFDLFLFYYGLSFSFCGVLFFNIILFMFILYQCWSPFTFMPVYLLPRSFVLFCCLIDIHETTEMSKV